MRPCKEEEKKLYVGSKYFPMYIYLIDYNENYIITKKYKNVYKCYHVKLPYV